jgi:hypothetical protein
MKFHAAACEMNVNGQHCSIYEIPDDPKMRGGGRANLVHMTRPHKVEFPCPEFQEFSNAA